MKALKIIGHPVLIMSLFMLILISGEAFGGPYLLYLILGLPHGVDYAVIGFLGLVCLFVSYKIFRGKGRNWLKPTLNLIGILLLLLSLYIFFINDRMRYNYNTFSQSVPMVSLILFGISVVCGIIINGLSLIITIPKKNGSHLDSLRSI